MSATRQQQMRDGSMLSQYTAWHRTWDRGAYCQDIDQLEYRYVDGRVVPVALLELTMYPGEGVPSDRNLAATLKRFTDRGGQRKAAMAFAEMLGCSAYLVLYRHDLELFAVYNLSKDRGWRVWSPDQYREWLENIASVAD